MVLYRNRQIGLRDRVWQGKASGWQVGRQGTVGVGHSADVLVSTRSLAGARVPCRWGQTAAVCEVHGRHGWCAG